MKHLAIPYGISDYKELRLSGMYYIDKTRYIEHLERKPRFLFLIRPRRFGKSLLISMLEAYYDRRHQSEFDEFFRDTHIGQHATAEHNSYYVLRLDFSAVDSRDADASFNTYVNQRLQHFIAKYQLDLCLEDANANNNLNRLFDYCNLNLLPLFILIDEYDNFINDLLARDEAEYRRLVTGQEAIYKQFFRSLKAGTSGTDAPVKRMFITGVSPVALFDVTSGYNIGTHITTDSDFNDFLGVTRAELDTMLQHYGLEGQREAIYTRMDEWYDGYRFSEEAEHTIFNTDMALYYLLALIEKGKEPKELIDLNVRSDYGKIRFLVQTDRRLNGNFSMLAELLATGRAQALALADSFSAFELRQRENFISLLFYLGLISIEKKEQGLLHLRIPNQTIRKIVGEFLQKVLKENELLDLKLERFNLLLRELAWFRKLDVFRYLAEQLELHSKLRDYISGESFIKGFLAAYLSLNSLYELSTEKEAGKGFVDLYLRPISAEVPYGAALELKYIKRNELTETLLEQKTQEALAQLQRYQLPENTVKVALVFHGWELVRVEEAGSS
jgi:hypothetical protein